MRHPRRLTALAVTATAAIAATSLTAHAASPTDTSDLRAAVTADGIMQHLSALQQIADAHNGTRASGTPGHTASAEYVAGLLTAAGYQVDRQQFVYDLFVETADPVLDPTSPDLPAYTPGEDFFTMEYSGSGDVTADVTPVDVTIPPPATPGSTSGCEASDFTGFPAGDIALIQRGTCTFRDKVDNATTAGASGVIIFNEGQDGRTDAVNGTLSPPMAAIPAVGASFAVGDELYQLSQQGPVTARLAVTAEVRQQTTENVIAQTPTGRTDRVIMAGAHLDSVLEGPGINDNGSGSGSILETALQMAELGIQPRNQVRFAFWGAEESGLLGSQYYVDSLTKAARKNIELYLNFDMVASPNYVRFVYDGDGSAFGLKGPSGSGHIEDVFTDFFSSQGLESAPTEFNGRSDYDAFISAGIPAGGLFTGAEGEKTAEQAATYGGLSTYDGQAVAYDPCYHQACDSLDPVADGADAGLYQALNDSYDGALEYNGVISNVNQRGLEEMSDAVAHAVLTFAMSRSSTNGTAKSSSDGGSSMLYQGNSLQR